MRRDELRELMNTLKLPVRGTKKDMIARLTEAQEEDNDPPPAAEVARRRSAATSRGGADVAAVRRETADPGSNKVRPAAAPALSVAGAPVEELPGTAVAPALRVGDESSLVASETGTSKLYWQNGNMKYHGQVKQGKPHGTGTLYINQPDGEQAHTADAFRGVATKRLATGPGAAPSAPGAARPDAAPGVLEGSLPKAKTQGGRRELEADIGTTDIKGFFTQEVRRMQDQTCLAYHRAAASESQAAFYSGEIRALREENERLSQEVTWQRRECAWSQGHASGVLRFARQAQVGQARGGQARGAKSQGARQRAMKRPRSDWDAEW
uniref:SAP domain-containing protein n=1 Tax=Zooxanthella nutricula TaxID=1333877 RepID=A0A6U6HPG2_9DINO